MASSLVKDTSLVDRIFRTFIMRTTFFKDGWGSAEDMRRIFELRRFAFASRENYASLLPDSVLPKVHIDKVCGVSKELRPIVAVVVVVVVVESTVAAADGPSEAATLVGQASTRHRRGQAGHRLSVENESLNLVHTAPWSDSRGGLALFFFFFFFFFY